MKKILLAMIIAAFFIACDNGNTKVVQQPAPVQPQPPVVIQPIEPEQPTIPTAGIGSIKGDMDCNGGTITTKYSFGNVDQNNKDFVIQYQRNGNVEDLVYPATTHNGSRATVQDTYYVGQNDDKNDAIWIVTINYQTYDETYTLVTTSIRQPKCDDNATARITTYQVK